MNILTEEQIVELLGRNGNREAMLQAAARMGAFWASDMCKYAGDVTKSESMAMAARTCAVAIRTAACE